MNEDEVDLGYDFEILLEDSGPPDPLLFLRDEPDRRLTRAEKAWVEENRSRNTDPATLTLAQIPSAPALRALGQSLQKYQGPMPATKEQWQNYVMQKYYELSQDLDPKVSKPALDALAKTNIIGLHKEVQEINITNKTTIEIESELQDKINRLLYKANEKVIN